MIPEDLLVWRRLQTDGEPNPVVGRPASVGRGHQPTVLDTGYLTADDLANPEIAANVRAMADTSGLITWVAEDEDESTAFGYWRGPQDTPLAEAPIVSLNSEGQFDLLPGNLSEARSIEYGEWSDEGYAGLAADCRAQGVSIAEDPDQPPEPSASPTPREYHASRYHELLAGN